MKKGMITILVTAASWSMLAQNVGIGTSSPVERLHVSGNILLSGEIKPDGTTGQAGQVLTSNGNGTMQWAAMTSGSGEGNGGWGDCSIQNITDFSPAANAGAKVGDEFGRAVSISGQYAIAGAPFDDQLAQDGGSATIFKYDDVTDSWMSQGKIFNPNAASSDQFGSAVSISGDYAIVGAHRDNENNLQGIGSVTIFKRNSNTGVWESQGKLTDPNPGEFDYFGLAVSISGDYAIVGSPHDDESGKTNCGSATVFKRNTSTGVWESQGKLLNPGAENDDAFGISVSISGIQAIVGAYLDDEFGATNSGSATVFKRNSNTGVWESQGKLFDDGFTNDYFGSSVSISGDYVICGIPGHFTGKGCALIYRRNTNTGSWEEQMRLYDPEGLEGDQFGSSVSMTSDYAMVSSPLDEVDGIYQAGSVTLFKKVTDGVWFVHERFSYPHPFNGGKFGVVSITSAENRFITGSRTMGQSKGLVMFGRVK